MKVEVGAWSRLTAAPLHSALPGPLKIIRVPADAVQRPSTASIAAPLTNWVKVEALAELHSDSNVRNGFSYVAQLQPSLNGLLTTCLLLSLTALEVGGSAIVKCRPPF